MINNHKSDHAIELCAQDAALPAVMPVAGLLVPQPAPATPAAEPTGLPPEPYDLRVGRQIMTYAAPWSLDMPRRGAPEDGLARVRMQRAREVGRAAPLAAIMAQAAPPRPPLLGDWLTQPGLAMVHAWRGTGKTWLALAIALAVARGGALLGWQAPAPRRVVLIDAETPVGELGARLTELVAGLDGPPPQGDWLRILACDTLGGPVDLATEWGQYVLAPQVAPADLVIVDTLSPLCGADVAEAGDWRLAEDWLLHLRRLGKTVVFFHHANRRGEQRGSARKEDALDVVLALRRPEDWGPQDGARFVIHFDKARALAGEAASPREVWLERAGGVARWHAADPERGPMGRAVALAAAGASQRAIARALCTSPATVNRLLRRARALAPPALPAPAPSASASPLALPGAAGDAETPAPGA